MATEILQINGESLQINGEDLVLTIEEVEEPVVASDEGRTRRTQFVAFNA